MATKTSASKRPATEGETPVDAVRAFNRFYTRRIGLLDDGLQGSGHTLSEVRVLYELAHGEDRSAGELARELDLDAGYMSRLIKRLHARGLVARTRSDSDGRRAVLALTAKGRRTFAPIEQATRDQVAGMLATVPVDSRERLLGSMRAIQSALDTDGSAQPGWLIRDPRPGDIGWIVHRHGVLYAQEHGWDASFEGLVAEIAGAFVRKHDPKREHCWIAERAGEVVGSIFVVRKSAHVAQLRLLYVEPSTRGLGIGARLVDECIAFARAAGYRSMMLWTNDVLGSARRIYQAVGFTLVEEERHHSFGKDLVGQNWSMTL